ncbi:uncharacterized protein LOC103710172 [Phoenix dactylifera]|uniref:Uncharacterized protein LOC103710172 n=1 Tax=Phoenix dactylifera TaxID=42345 RepID=A0A8B7C8I4_PHODC|nr:uncharacterized protein LOC103710172 [Phoenix dactylifera]
MGEHEGWAEPSGLLPNGLLPNEVANVTRVLDAERWSTAEERTGELIARIQPNQPSEERRNAVANYVQRLIMKCFSCQVFTFGSVPLKTYLPDGDIDLTAFSNNENLKDTWANEVRYVLENEEKSENAEFHVKEVQYIQAEVKIIKCLVEDIVVDISFNQVGGLCTLCFLEQIDHLINQNHLFKRSIILIKAWCYYESRILGAHHGLISTYALETLVLYIFHVFNNSFSGPLEVLYRFLEFFSNFDWDNFCVSLWGPVPVSSLPDMTAVPPREDGGELLLSKPFDALSVAYAVKPSGQENQSQPFISKHFNVIDPLRTNNNLGRSVSKGNFFRIRSAFAFGAKKLARLLDCPKEDLIAEVNQFFMNTWERHGSGHRPDAPCPNLRHVRTLKTVPVEESNSSRNNGSIKNSRNSVLQDGHEHVVESGHDHEDPSSEVVYSISQRSQNVYRMNNPSTPFHNQSQKNNGVQMNSRVYGQFERNISSSGSVQSDKNQKILRPQRSVNDQGQGRFHFARTRSSPELTEASVEVLSQGRPNGVVETTKTQNTPARLDFGRRIRNLVSEATGSHSMSSFDDPTSIRHITSHQSFEAGSDANSVSNSYHDDLNFSSIGEELASASEALEMQQEEQDLVNMIASSKLHNLNGQVQLPMHLASPHLPLTISPLLASMGYVQRNLAGMVPTNLSLIGPSWGSNMQFPQGPFSSPLSQYYHPAGLSSNHDDMVESVSESSGMTGLNTEDGDQDFWKDDAGSTRGFNPENRTSQMLHFNGKQQSTPSGSNFSSSSRGSISGAGSQGQHKFAREDREPVREDHIDAFQNQASRVNDIDSNARNANVRFSPVSQANSSRNKPGYESSRDGSTSRVSRSARDKWGRKPFSSAGLTSLHGKARSGWQVEGSSDHDSVEVEDDSRDSIPLSTMGSDISERTAGSASLTSSHVSNHQLHGYEPAHISGSDSMSPIAPVLVGTSRQRTVDNSGLVPMTFFPTGPLVPFLMLPVYNFTSDTGNSDGLARQFDHDERADNCQISPSDQNFGSLRNLDQAEAPLSLTASGGAAFEPLGEKSDILNSDFASHLQNLLYGRFCQDTHLHGPLIYPSPAAAPPVNLQGHFPLDGPGRPLSANVNFTQVMTYGPRLVPVMPIQPVPDRTSGVFQRYGDEAPRYRGGTGTYLPNPKVSFRDRQSMSFRDRQSSSRNHRGNYGYDRSDHGDREGSWINSKTRAAGRSHMRSQAERPPSWPDQLAASEHHADRQWESQRHEPAASYLVPNNSFVSTKSSHGSTNMAYAFHRPPVAGSDGVSPANPTIPPVFMVYSPDHGVGYDSSTEPLEFGSLGSMHLSGTNEAPRPNDGNPASGLYEQRHGTYFGGSPRSSPEQPSSPQLHR